MNEDKIQKKKGKVKREFFFLMHERKKERKS